MAIPYHQSLEEIASVEPAVRPGILADAEFLVFKTPLRLSREQAARLSDSVRHALAFSGPVLVLEEGADLEVIRSGGWVYTYERPSPPSGYYEVAIETPIGPHVLLATYRDRWLEGDPILPGDPLGAEPYAYRPAPAPPPVRRSVPPSDFPAAYQRAIEQGAVPPRVIRDLESDDPELRSVARAAIERIAYPPSPGIAEAEREGVR